MDCCKTPGLRWRYGQHDLIIQFAVYGNGSLAVLAMEGDCEPYAKLSVNMPGEPPPAGVFFLKDWTENKHIATALMHSGLIESASDTTKSRYTDRGWEVLPWRFVDRELTFDEAEQQGWDGTGRDLDERHPYHVHDIWQAAMLDGVMP